MIQRADAETLLKENGDYLLRKTESNGWLKNSSFPFLRKNPFYFTGLESLALSVYWANQVRHFIIKETEDGNVYFEDGGPQDRDVERLIRRMFQKKTPITKQSGVVLKRSIPREEWVLTHESITLAKKPIGTGQFGEVGLLDFFMMYFSPNFRSH